MQNASDYSAMMRACDALLQVVLSGLVRPQGCYAGGYESAFDRLSRVRTRYAVWVCAVRKRCSTGYLDRVCILVKRRNSMGEHTASEDA